MISNTKKNIYVGTSSFKGHLGLTAKGKKYSLRKNETVELELTPEDFKKLNYPTKFLTFVIKTENAVKVEEAEISEAEIKVLEAKVAATVEEEVKVEEAKEEVVEIKETIEETKEPEVKETKKPARKSRKKAVKIETEENE